MSKKMMTPYKNLSRTSGVAAYKIARDSIAVEFADCAIYLYTEKSAERSNIEQMKDLAVSGIGLSTFIVQHVRNAYEARLR